METSDENIPPLEEETDCSSSTDAEPISPEEEVGKKETVKSGSDIPSKSRGGTTVKDKEPHMVARRNARERRRVQLVNEGFMRLRRKIPTEPRNKKLSKVKTLQSAINYILHLQETIEEADNERRSSGMIEFSPVGAGIGVGMSSVESMTLSHHPNSHHVASPVQPICYNDWSYFENTSMCNYEYQDVRANYYY